MGLNGLSRVFTGPIWIVVEELCGMRLQDFLAGGMCRGLLDGISVLFNF